MSCSNSSPSHFQLAQLGLFPLLRGILPLGPPETVDLQFSSYVHPKEAVSFQDEGRQLCGKKKIIAYY